jgi:hypothetical protein
VSRIVYGDDDDGGMPAGLWHATLKRALKSKRGQAVLREVEAALVALPRKRLIDAEGAIEGDVCVLGALDWHRRVRKGAEPQEALVAVEREDIYDLYDPFSAADHLGIARTIAWELMERNDERYGLVEPEERYELLLRDVRVMIGAGEGNTDAC